MLSGCRAPASSGLLIKRLFFLVGQRLQKERTQEATSFSCQPVKTKALLPRPGKAERGRGRGREEEPQPAAANPQSDLSPHLPQVAGQGAKRAGLALGREGSGAGGGLFIPDEVQARSRRQAPPRAPSPSLPAPTVLVGQAAATAFHRATGDLRVRLVLSGETPASPCWATADPRRRVPPPPTSRAA